MADTLNTGFNVAWIYNVLINNFGAPLYSQLSSLSRLKPLQEILKPSRGPIGVRILSPAH